MAIIQSSGDSLIVIYRPEFKFYQKLSYYLLGQIINKNIQHNHELAIENRDVVARFVRALEANCHAPGFDARRRGTAHPVIKCGTGCWALSPAQV